MEIKSATKAFAFSALSVIVLVGFSHGLQCYVCNSAYDEGCNSDLIPQKYLVECNSKTAKPVFQGGSGDTRNFTVLLDRLAVDDEETQNGLHFTTCRKDDATIPDQYHSAEHWRKGGRRIFRSCGWLGKPQNRCKRISHEPIFLIECTCSEDNCNSGHQLQITNYFLILGHLAILVSNLSKW